MRRIRDGKLGKIDLRLFAKDAGYIGVAVADGDRKAYVEGDSADSVWRKLHDEVGKAHPRYFGFDGARKQFQRFFPGGFHSADYVGAERAYKIAAKSKLDKTVPLAQAVDGSGFGEAVLAVYRATNLLASFEMMRMQELLRGPTADTFIRAAARFTLGGGAKALLEMDGAMKGQVKARWTAATYLPFLWRPDMHMFLKPEVTKDFADRVGHPFTSVYEARLGQAIYDSLLDLVAKTTAELTQLNPLDGIDVQSFIWVIGKYTAEDIPHQEEVSS
jgi:hypothetical protein